MITRFLSRDPLPNAERKQGPNLYAYVNDNPLVRTDSSGLGYGDVCCRSVEYDPGDGWLPSCLTAIIVATNSEHHAN